MSQCSPRIANYSRIYPIHATMFVIINNDDVLRRIFKNKSAISLNIISSLSVFFFSFLVFVVVVVVVIDVVSSKKKILLPLPNVRSSKPLWKLFRIEWSRVWTVSHTEWKKERNNNEENKIGCVINFMANFYCFCLKTSYQREMIVLKFKKHKSF